LWLGWSLAVLAIAVFVRLGVWQSQRAVEKQAMLDAAAQVLTRREPVPLAAAADPAHREAYDWAAGRGRFAERGPLWLDNQQRNGRAGVRTYRVFLPEQGPPLLVDLGWRPLPADRTLPPSPRPPGVFELRGLLAPPPSSGLALGDGIAAHGDGWLLTRLQPARLAEATGMPGPLAARVLRLDPALAGLGYERDLELLANTLSPDKHRGYALQWFGLALTVLVVALVLTFRRSKR
jgi:cytochrome oxidase assembly protein ShyY1